MVNRTTIVDYLADELRSRLGLEKEPRYQGFIDTSSSYLLKFSISAKSTELPRDLAVKLHKKTTSVDVPCNPSENEYRFLKYLSHISPDIPQLVIPKPIMILPELNCVVMEWINGTPLRKLMSLGARFNSLREKQRIETYFSNVGEMIGLIQARTYRPTASEAELFMATKLKNIKNQTRDLCPRIYSKHIEKALKCVDDVISTIPWGTMGSTFTHGDFVYSNVLINTEDKIAIFDLVESRFDLPYNDISRFIVRTIIDYSAGHFMPKYNAHYLNELTLYFLKGYRRLFPHEISDDFFLPFCIFNILQSFSFPGKQSFRSFYTLRDWQALFLLKNYIQSLPVGGIR